VVIQKVAEKCSDAHRQKLIEVVADHLASFGIHKNGTWAVQKIIECAKTPGQIDAIVNALRTYAPALLLDQFGNYVVQCCLRLGEDSNQFVFDAMVAKCWELGQGRFGARAMRACLESSYTTKRQQKEVSASIIHYSVQLAMNANGTILITWLFELSAVAGRYRSTAQAFVPHLVALTTHKLSTGSVLKLGNCYLI
jgi:cytochrome oxidase Cu insertion factor (SCO1/SenC/PrrC family)